MSREEFIEVLQKTLAGSLMSGSVNENVRYYQDYIDVKIRGGSSPEDVIRELGDPRLLAKSIIEAEKHAGTGVDAVYEEVYEDGDVYGEPQRSAARVYRMPGWLIALIVVFIIITIIGIAASVVWAILPFLIPCVLVIFLIRYFKR